ncbi:hypothetical protein I551_6939 [Mycobacterium ulcerans str. Harvey]|uniref:Uncharacterized protein n=1 Tax=Mycobacterium ulcerans str. Harvey TaxID=1299332 RepID=A0ABN0QQ23_MYCUL|nr:hypothetical protein I551_6939 [Mycobacterium ulcerans str. Harvey]
MLRYADVGITTYASLRVVGQPSRTFNWVVDEPILLAALAELTDALPEPTATRTGARPSNAHFAGAHSQRGTAN